VEGPIYSEVSTIIGQEDSTSFRTSVRIYHNDVDDKVESDFRSIDVENFFDFGSGSVSDLDVFFRLSTDIKNVDERQKPYFFSDLVRTGSERQMTLCQK
jgi:hypothetical protein